MTFIVKFSSTNCANNLNRFYISGDLIIRIFHKDTRLEEISSNLLPFPRQTRPRRETHSKVNFPQLFVSILDLLCSVLLPLSYAPSLTSHVHRSVVSSETFALKVRHPFSVSSNNWTFTNSLLSNYRSNALKRNTYEISVSLKYFKSSLYLSDSSYTQICRM